MNELYMYVWSGDDVLRNYGSGIVAILAFSELEAWEKLKVAEPSAFYNLMYGCGGWVESEEEYKFWLEDEDEPKPPILPVRHELENAPVIVKWGSS